MITPNYDLDIDSTLGGDNASDYVISSQKAIKSYVDNNSVIPSNMVTTDTAQNITGVKTFVGQKMIGFKQSASGNKLGFTLYNNNNVEKGYLEYNPSNLIDSVPLMTLGNYATAAAGLTHVGFRKYSSISGASGAYNLLAPLISDARTPFNLTTTYTNFYLPLGFTDGNTTVLTAKSGLVDLSSLLPSLSGYATEAWVGQQGYALASSLSTVATSGSYSDLIDKPTIPTVNNATLTITQGGVSKGTFTANASSDVTIALDSGGGGTATDVQINGTSITSSNVANIITNSAYNSSSNKIATMSDLPTVNNATLTIQKNGTTVKTFTANASTGVTANITVPTKTSDLTNDSSFITGITSSDVTTALGYTPYNSTNPNGYQANVIETIKVNNVAQTITSKTVNITVPSAVTESTVSGWGFTKNVGTVTSVNNVSPVNGNVSLTIPTVNNATLTIQKNGTTVKTFTANASSDVTANITVPTKTSDLTNDSSFITGITSSDVTTALGYTPYSSANPNGYQANVIETIKVNNVAQTVTSKAVNISVPTKVSQLTNDSGYTSNVGTVTSVNNVSPVDGNVSLTIPTVNNATLTIQKNGTTVKTFTANASSNVTANITVPTKTSDLTNDSSFITGITSSDVTTALGYTPYSSANPSGYQANVIETIKVNNVAQTVTSKAVNITVPSAVTETTVSNWGFTKNTGTVTSVNNTQPDSSGNVTLTGYADTDLNNLSATGEAHFQTPLVSGTNIKTINNNSILGSGNITVTPTVTYDQTTQTLTIS